MSLLRRPSPATVIALVALFVALGGPAQAAKLIDGGKIKKNTVRSKQIRNKTIVTKDLATSTIRSLRAVRSSSIGNAQLKNGAVTSEKLTVNSVLSATIADRTIQPQDIAANSITSGEIADGAITGSDIATNTITQNKIGPNAIGQGELRTDAVISGKIVDREVKGRDIGAQTVALDMPNVTQAGTATACAIKDVTLSDPLQATDAGSIVIIPAQISDEVTLTARATSATALRFKGCNTSGLPVDLASATVSFLAVAP